MKILYVSTLSNTINAFMIPHIKLLLKQGHTVDIACNIKKDINISLIENGCGVYNIDFNRIPFSRKNIVALKKLKRIIIEQDYDLIHTHTPVASLLVRLVCKNIKNIKVIYTAHGFHFYKGAPALNWLLYYPLERYLSKYTELIITINKEDFNRSKKFHSNRIEYLPSVGLDVEKYRNIIVNKNKKRKEIGLKKNEFCILSVGELNKNKNHEVIIRALKRINNPNIIYIICGRGPLEKYLKRLSKKLGVEKQVKLLGFRSDLSEIYNISDVFVFPSKREGLGMAALEAMAAGLPIVTSNIHGILDYSLNGVTGFNCNPTDVEGFATNIKKIYEDTELQVEISQTNKEFVEKFNINSTLKRLEKIYNSYI